MQEIFPGFAVNITKPTEINIEIDTDFYHFYQYRNGSNCSFRLFLLRHQRKIQAFRIFWWWYW